MFNFYGVVILDMDENISSLLLDCVSLALLFDHAKAYWIHLSMLSKSRSAFGRFDSAVTIPEKAWLLETQRLK
ncbi:unnamed protein product [Urochloa humidicola]